MRVISKRKLREFWQQYSDAELPLMTWYKAAMIADWDSLQSIRKTFPQADGVTLDCDLVVTVFNISGNKYRLIARIIYEYRRIYVKRVLTHREYDTNKWKGQLCRE